MRRLIVILSGFLLLNNAFGQADNHSKIWHEGVDFIMKGDFLRGLERMNEYLAILPYNASALFNKGNCLFYLGDEKEACKDLLEARNLGFKGFGELVKYRCDTVDRLNYLINQFYQGVHIYPELGYRPKYTRHDTLRGALRPERTCFDVYFYNLSVRVHPVKKEIEGKNEIWFKGISESKEIQIDLFENYTVKKILLDSITLSYQREYDAVFINMPEPVQPGKNYKITVEYSGKPRVAPNPPWDGGFVWSRDKHLHRWVGVACEQLGASSWWPTKDHLSDKPDSMAINLEVPKRYKAVCNGSLRRITYADNRFNRFEWFVHYPINNYNVTFYMGKYVEFTDTLFRPSDTLILRYDVLPYQLEKARQHFQQAKEIVGYYSDAFGPFPFRKDNYRLVESPYEGMENQTAIAYGENFDNEKNGRTYLNKKYDFIIVHESAHEWWGNSVTAGDMADVWIHEGFATYAEYLFIEHAIGYDAAITEYHDKMKFINKIWPIVQNRNVNENEFAGSTVYYKGATLLQCLRATIDNDTLFKNMLRDFQLQYKYKVVCTDDFIQFVDRYTKNDYGAFFDKFLYKTDAPVLEYEYERCDSNLVLKYKWTGVKDGFVMPFSIKIIGDKKAYRIIASTKEQEITIENASSFTFFNMSRSPDGCPHNGLTYFETKCRNFL
jgi:aminopeptidase N